jgi:ABC-type glycerol-3-phosphate transport system permease component
MSLAKTKRLLVRAISYFFLIGLMLVMIFPFYWMVTASLKPEDEIMSSKLTLVPSEPSLRSYVHLLEGRSTTGAAGKPRFHLWFLNSVVVACGTTLLGVAVCSMAGFAFAKYDFRGRQALFAILLGSALIPAIVTLLPMFVLMSRVHWLNTYQVLIVPPAVSAFGVFYLRQYILGISDELLDAARIDGCSELRIFWSIILPLSRPGLAVLAISLFLGSWISYLWPLIMSRTGDMFTLPLGLASMYGTFGDTKYGPVMAGSTLATLPLLLFAVLSQKHLVRGLMEGAIR